ncbi:prepilin-type N-terminal cleavage/methylation domain-containing protein [Candidatus Sulfurimonas marisnigri]|uniref:Prepilin-type N-terminal cleavage/methylation domain-containing protein n=1 Tax=Candidatus Sulfurimonas marisnigri TaxID=2740405 RepID=A0A7S7M199_9BACT|nr:prepilin-type N-terminal cleavage/methylation domain-containing protein [Candidatus Sulfurimonas marisnigri]QOY55209.1 prepilin-type N-terminal cleavage/methylation domain-containing protein [Candidatus Sulfurimonas marisnigri]
MKKAFTMLELVMVIVVVGIISAVVIPRTQSNSLREAAVQVISHIRYTQHLAMVDDKFNANNPNWFVARWQIFFQLDNSGNGNNVYSIYSDRDLDDAVNPDNGEMALNPLSKEQMTGNSLFNDRTRDMDLSEQYGINNINTDSCAAGVQRIFFDHLGRPHVNNNTLYGDLLTNRCSIVLINGEGNITIAVEPETGYAHIL